MAGQWGKDPQVNKFELVSALGHQMSLAGGRARVRGLHRRGAGDRGSCMMRSNASWVMVTWEPLVLTSSGYW